MAKDWIVTNKRYLLSASSSFVINSSSKLTAISKRSSQKVYLTEMYTEQYQVMETMYLGFIYDIPINT